MTSAFQQNEEPPILRATGPEDNLLSKDWVAKSAVQRIGVAMIATVFFLGSCFMLLASTLLKTDPSTRALGNFLGPATMFLLGGLAFLIAGIGLFVSIRLMRGVVRSLRRERSHSSQWWA